MRNQFFASVALAAVIVPHAAYAQETTSSVEGTVTSDGQPVAGAEVRILHVPSGTTNTATTDASGSFSTQGLRIGGPFTVTVTADGFAGAQVTDIFTVVGQPYTLPLTISPTGEEIIVTASRLPGARTVSQGPATVLNAEQIANVASVNRDIRDLARRDPFARLDDSPTGGRSISFAGQNARYNKFSVDGVPITDNFGLNPDGLPSRRSPIPLDAIGQFQAKVAPYDVREGNFQGGAINIILKSGNNDFQGTGFFAYLDQSLVGKETKPGPGIPTGRITVPPSQYKNYGAQLSGPIIPDKLFFMIAGERVRAEAPIAEGPSDNNSGTAIALLAQAQVDNVSSIAKSRYGYDTGGVLKTNGDTDDRLVARIDANLSDTQRLSLTYTYAKDAINLIQNTFATGTQGLGLASNAYIQGNKLQTGVFQLNTEISDDFSTEVRGFIKDYKRIQDPLLGRGFAQMTVCTAPTSDRTTTGVPASASINCPVTSASVSFGPDVSRQTNALTSRTYGGLIQGRLTRNNHDLRLFVDIQTTEVFNSFLQRSSGDYYFDSIADFEAGNAQRFRYGNAVPSLIPENAAAGFGYQSYTFGVQDTWRVSDTLTVAYGARYDLFGGNSRAVLNPTYLGRYGFANNAFISGRGVFQPRFGFDWKPSSDVSIRGGLGIFSGGTPDVYVSNSFSNTGVLTNAIDIQQLNNGAYSPTTLPAGAGASILTNVNGATIPTAANSFLTNATVSGNSPTASLAQDFKIPSQWRGTLSLSSTPDLGPLGTGWEFGIDLFVSGVRKQVSFTDLRVRPNSLLTPDGRVRYTPITTFADTNSDILLTNSSVGRSYVGVARIRKDFDFGLNVGGSFTYQNIRDSNPATSSVAVSNYGAGVALDANTQAYGTANDEVKYAFKYDLTFQRELFGDYKSTIALFGETRIGRPYSYTFRDLGARSSVFGTTGTGTRYLMYVPTGIDDPRVSYANATDAGLLDNYINSTGLSKYRGKIAPRNGFNSPWFTRVDLHLSQEIPAFISARSRFTLFADVENFTNLINKNWGQIREFSFPYTISPVQVQCLTTPLPTGQRFVNVGTPAAQNPGNLPAVGAANTGQACAQYRYVANQTSGGLFTAPTDTIYARQSLYAIRVGVRFSF